MRFWTESNNNKTKKKIIEPGPLAPKANALSLHQTTKNGNVNKTILVFGTYKSSIK